MPRAHPFDINKCARPNILQLRPYTCDRDDYPPDARVTLLDANENAFGPCLPLGLASAPSPTTSQPQLLQSLSPEHWQLHRYPDAHSTDLKHALCDYRNAERAHVEQPLEPHNVCLGVGSDESIDAILRAFCTPGKDKILITPPTYSMYQVSAQVNDVQVTRVDLDASRGFALRPRAICDMLSQDPTIKVVFICSPGNPAGNLLDRADILEVLNHPSWNGVVVLDEAYIDFVPSGTSFAPEVNEWPNLIVTQTMSKAFGLAGIRLGITYAQPQIIALLNGLRGPYNMSAPTVNLASAALTPTGISLMRANIDKIVQQRDHMRRELAKIPGFGGFLGQSTTNFLLVQFLSRPAAEGGTPDSGVATALKHALRAESSILVRDRCKEVGCTGAVRITVGTEKEVGDILEQIRTVLGEIYARQN